MPSREKRSRLVGWLGASWHIGIGIHSVNLCMECVVHSSPNWLIPFSNVVDGLDVFCEHGLRDAVEETNPRTGGLARYFVRDVKLLEAENIQPRNYDLSFARIAIRRLQELASPCVREMRIPVLQLAVQVRALPVLKNAGEVCCSAIACDISAAWIRDGTAKVRVLPHLRRSVNLESLSSSISAGFLREATEIKGVQSGAGELLAVFRRVPLAMISRVCFLEERGVLLYTIPSSGEPSRTRVHDLAAVRDRRTQKTHLVAHRTRYKTAFLH